MFAEFQSLPVWNLVLAAVTMILVGISRTGFRGASVLAIPVFAAVFGARLSTSVVLLMYITADLVAIGRFRETVKWNLIVRLAPWTIAGVVAGTAFGSLINDRVFALTIGVIVLVTLSITVFRELRGSPVNIEGKHWLSPPLGLVSGFTSMVGNAAGAFMTPYMLALGLDKTHFLGTSAWFFFFLNLAKLPFHIFVWKSISGQSLLVNAIAVIPILLGTWIGALISGKVSERAFRYASFALAAAGAVRLLVQ